ncbi:MAG: hypothetical protein HRT87_07155 [Legionellales bacterium]|nr:hypothetical protein [Legionellales bacterium]
MMYILERLKKRLFISIILVGIFSHNSIYSTSLDISILNKNTYIDFSLFCETYLEEWDYKSAFKINSTRKFKTGEYFTNIFTELQSGKIIIPIHTRSNFTASLKLSLIHRYSNSYFWVPCVLNYLELGKYFVKDFVEIQILHGEDKTINLVIEENGIINITDIL